MEEEWSINSSLCSLPTLPCLPPLPTLLERAGQDLHLQCIETTVLQTAAHPNRRADPDNM